MGLAPLPPLPEDGPGRGRAPLPEVGMGRAPLPGVGPGRAGTSAAEGVESTAGSAILIDWLGRGGSVLGIVLLARAATGCAGIGLTPLGGTGTGPIPSIVLAACGRSPW